MPYTESQQTEIKEQFRAKRRKQLLLCIPVALLFIVGWMGKLDALPGSASSLVLAGFLVGVAAVVAFTLFNWRCPVCNGYLGKGMSPRFCSKCGVALQ